MLSLAPRQCTQLTIRPQTISRSILTERPELQESVCELISEYVGTDFGRGLTPLSIDTRREKIQWFPNSPTSAEPTDCLQPRTASESGTLSANKIDVTEIPHPRRRAGFILNPLKVTDDIGLLAAHLASRAAATTALRKWQYLFDQIYLPETSPQDNRNNLNLFKALLTSLNIDEVLLYVKNSVPVLGNTRKKATLLAFHRIFNHQNYAKALFLTCKGLIPSDLNNYYHLRTAGYSRNVAARITLHAKSIRVSDTNLPTVFDHKASATPIVIPR